MIFNCKSGSSPHCDCVHSITVEKVDAFLDSADSQISNPSIPSLTLYELRHCAS